MGAHALYDAARGVMTDRAFPHVTYLPENVHADLHDRQLCYTHPETGAEMRMSIDARDVYVLPNGYQL